MTTADIKNEDINSSTPSLRFRTPDMPPKRPPATIAARKESPITAIEGPVGKARATRVEAKAPA